MNIAIVGYGNMGSALAQVLVKAGHKVVLTGRNLAKADEVANRTGAKALPGPQAALDADIILAGGCVASE